MKKFLSLVMALVMVMSLTAVASAADYKDAADIDQTEAVEVMSAVGVFQGSDGKFSPKEILTRAQAAKLIAYLDLGDDAEDQPAVGMFSDVPASHWAAKYVDYCADAGYINGVGNGKFDPNGKLTGYAFGKMILCAMGYDAAIEGFTGSNWTIAVAKLMKSNKINDEVKAAPTGDLTRENAARYCLNALAAPMVGYEDKGTTIEINGAVISTGAKKASTKFADYAYLWEKLYGEDLVSVGGKDDFGAPSTTWTYKKDEVGTYSDSVEATFEGKVYSNKVYNVLGKTLVEDLQDGKGELIVYVDGDIYSKAKPADIVKDSTAKLFGCGDPGIVTDIYVGDYAGADDYDDVIVVVKNTYVVKASSDYNKNTEKLVVKDLTGKSVTKLTLELDDFAAIADMKKDDYALVTVAKKEIQSFVKAELLTAEVTATTAGKDVTLAGETYKFSAKAPEGTMGTKFSIGKTAVVVLDAQGAIIFVDKAEKGSDDIFFVKEIYKDGLSKNAATKAIVVDMKGVEKTVTVDTKDSDVTEGFIGFVKYTVDGEKYELVEDTDADYDTANLVNKATSYDGMTVNSATVLVIYNAEDEEYTVYTGTKNFPDVKVDGGVFYVVDGTKITYMYAQVKTADDIDEPNASTDDLFVVTKVSTDVKNNGTIKYTETKIVTADGTEKTLKVKEGATCFTKKEVGVAFESMKVNADGLVTSATKLKTEEDKYIADFFYIAPDEFKVDEDVLTVGTSSMYVANDKAMVIAGSKSGELLKDADATYEIKDASTLSDVESLVMGYYVGGYVYMTLNSDGEITSTIIYVTYASETDAE